MANTIKIKRSGTSGDSPTSGELQHGELGINYADGKLFFKNSSNVIQELLTSPGTSNGQLLFANSSSNFQGSSNLSWNNSSNVLSTGGHIIPLTDNAIDLGSTSDKDFRKLYIRDVEIYNQRLNISYYNLKATYKDHASVGDGHEFSHRGTVAMQIGKPSSTSPYIGIGTTSPSYQLTLDNTGGDPIMSFVGNTARLKRSAVDFISYDGAYLDLSSSSALDLNTGGSQRLRIDSSGTATFSGIVSATNYKINGSQGSDGQVLTSTGSGVAWELPPSTDVGALTSNIAVVKSFPDIFTKSSNEGRIGFMDAGGSIQSGMKNASGDLILIADGNTERVRINSTGVGIGQTSPSYKLDVTGTGRFTSNLTTNNLILSSRGTQAAPALYFDGDSDTGMYQTTDNRIQFSVTNNKVLDLSYYNVDVPWSLRVGTNATTVLTYDGKVGIGTATPSQLLHIEGASFPTALVKGGSSGAIFRLQGANNDYIAFHDNTADKWLLRYQPGADKIDFYNNGTSASALTILPLLIKS